MTVPPHMMDALRGAAASLTVKPCDAVRRSAAPMAWHPDCARIVGYLLGAPLGTLGTC